MFEPSPDEVIDQSLAALVSYSERVLQRKEQEGRSPRDRYPVSSVATSPRPAPLLSTPGAYVGAAPLMPLRDRDIQALTEWFTAESLAEIEADILYNLLLRYPEPCWEDDPFDFLDEDLLPTGAIAHAGFLAASQPHVSRGVS